MIYTYSKKKDTVKAIKWDGNNIELVKLFLKEELNTWSLNYFISSDEDEGSHKLSIVSDQISYISRGCTTKIVEVYKGDYIERVHTDKCLIIYSPKVFHKISERNRLKEVEKINE